MKYLNWAVDGVSVRFMHVKSDCVRQGNWGRVLICKCGLPVAKFWALIMVSAHKYFYFIPSHAYFWKAGVRQVASAERLRITYETN